MEEVLKKNIYFMSKGKDNGILDGILAGLAILGGAFLTTEILKAFSEKKTVYSCPNCNSDIELNIKKCPNCHVLLNWGKENNNG